jgi:hypothetical protein
MSSSAKISSIDVLDELAAGLGQYSAHAQQVMEVASAEAQRTLEWLAQRQRFWHNEILRRTEMRRRAAAIYNDCKRPRNGSSNIPACDEEWEQLRKVERYLAEAEAEEQAVIRAKHAVQSASEHYYKEARQLRHTLQQQLPTSAAWLRRKSAILRSYAAGNPGLSLADVFAGAAILGVGLAVALADRGQDAPAAGAQDSAPHTGKPGPAATTAVREVMLDQIDLSDSYVKSEADYKKVSYADMLAGVQRLARVQRMLAQGATDDDFYALDQQEGLDAAHGYVQTYRAFYGNDAIALEKAGTGYRVINGYHRLAIARSLGLTNIPARIINL